MLASTSLWYMHIWEFHPMMVHFPIALLLGAVVLDWWALRRPSEILNRVSAGLLVSGVVLGWLAAASGLLSFYTVPAYTEKAHNWMWWHLGFAVGMMLLFTWLCVVRWRQRTQPATSVQLSVGTVAAVLLLVTGWLGGAIVYRGGAGVTPELLAEEIRDGHSHLAQSQEYDR